MASSVIFVYIITSVLITQVVAVANEIDHKLLKDSNTSHKQDLAATDEQLLWQCLNSSQNNYGVPCSDSGPRLILGYCATYNQDTKFLSIYVCPYFQPDGHKALDSLHFLLPNNISQLNDYMCGPMNRKGIVCSECADGFGPSLTSFRYRCINCTDAWYRVPIFLVLEFVPITVLYLVILVFHISVTSAPMPCFIMLAQIIVITSDSINCLSNMMINNEGDDLRPDMKIVLALYKVFNLEFGRNLLPHFCLSSKLQFIHVALLGYISAFYPLFLIFLTWACIELHDRSFQPIVWLWRPFHRTCVRLRRGWDPKSDIIDSFITFFLLSYSKIFYQTVLLISSDIIKNFNGLGEYYDTLICRVDPSINYGTTNHLPLAISAAVISVIFNLLPPMLLILYPIRAFRSCLAKCRLNFIVVHTFIEKVYGCYRDGLDGGRDMRPFSAVHFFLRIVACFSGVLSHAMSRYLFHSSQWFVLGTLFFMITLIVALSKPYKKVCMNYLEVLLLSNFVILCYVQCPGFRTLLVARILITTPIVAFTLVITLKKLHNVSQRHCTIMTLFKSLLRKCVHSFSSIAKVAVRSTQNSIINSPTEVQPLLQPTSTELSYDSTKNY